MRHPLTALSLLCISIALVGCFGPSGHGAPDGGDSSSGRGGTSGAAGGQGGPFGGAAGAILEPPPDLLCGSQFCAFPDQPLAGLIEPCCAPSGACSLRMAGAFCEELPEADPFCGTQFVAGAELPGCCLDGHCGANATTLGLGCVSAETLATVGVMIERRPCFEPFDDAGVDTDDAGT